MSNTRTKLPLIRRIFLLKNAAELHLTRLIFCTSQYFAILRYTRRKVQYATQRLNTHY